MKRIWNGSRRNGIPALDSLGDSAGHQARDQRRRRHLDRERALCPVRFASADARSLLVASAYQLETVSDGLFTRGSTVRSSMLRPGSGCRWR